MSRLPDTRRLLPPQARERFSETLRRFEAESAGKPLRIGSVRYLSGRRRACVFEITAEREGRTERFYLKLGARDSDEIFAYIATEAQRTRQAWEAMSRPPGFAVARPVAHYDDLAALILAGAEGERLDRLIVRSARLPRVAPDDAAADYCRTAARWLREFQQRLSTGDAELVSLEDLKARAEREIIALGLLLPEKVSASDCKRYREAMWHELDAFEDADRVVKPRHNDFAPWNMICAGGELCVLDFADLRSGCRYFDVFQFCDALDVLGAKPMVSRRVLNGLREAFLSECDFVDPGRRAPERYFRLLHLLIRINAVMDNSRSGFPFDTLNRQRVVRYLRELDEAVAA